MEQGILKGDLLNMTKIKTDGMSMRGFQVFAIYKHYILGFESIRSSHGDCSILDTQKGIVTHHKTGLNLGDRTGYSICYWKDNIFVLYGGSSLIPGGQPKKHFLDPTPKKNELDVHFIYITEENSDLNIRVEACGLDDPTWWSSHHSVQIYQDNMYVIGSGGIEDDTAPFEVLKFDLNAKTWTKCQIAGESPKWRISPISALFGNKIYVFGGKIKNPKRDFGPGLVESFNDLFVLNLENMIWEKIYENDFLPNSYFAYNSGHAEVVGQKIYIDAANLDEFFIYDPSNQISFLIYFITQFPKVNNRLEKSQNVPPKYGYKIRSHQNNSILFNISTNVMEDFFVEFQEFRHFNQTEENKENEREKNLSQVDHISLLWKEKTFADVTFIVENEEILAHRNILIKFEYFRNLFNAEKNSIKIPISNISPENFKNLLEYMYFGSLALTETLALNLITLADNFLLPELKADCESYLSKNLKTENLLSVIKTAEAAGSNEFKDKIVSYLATNMKDLKQEIDVNLIPNKFLSEAILKSGGVNNNQ